MSDPKITYDPNGTELVPSGSRDVADRADECLPVENQDN